MVGRRRGRPAGEQQKSRLAMISLLSWFSIHAIEATPQLQHRVQRPTRTVDYRHTIAGGSRGPYEKFWIPSKTGTDVYEGRSLTRNSESGTLVKHREENGDISWMYSVQAPSSTRKNASSNNLSKGVFRRLYDQFIGEDKPEGDLTDATLINAEVLNASSGNEKIVYTAAEEDQSNATQFQPLRLRAILAESFGSYLFPEELDALFHDIISPALLSWSSSLRVDPVVGNLTVDVNQLLDGESCGPGVDSGLPSIRVPPEHVTEGIPDTDMIVYLSLGFANPRNASNTTNTTDFGEEADSDRFLKLRDENNPGGNIFREVEGKRWAFNESDPGVCNGDFLAASSFCSTDQYDRPTAALLHICIDDEFFQPDKLQRNILTLMHELGHALGFNSLSMAHFRRPDGTPYTPRVDGNIPDTEVECTGPHVERRWANVALPSEEILQFREVRGGVRVAELVTPSIVQVVRNQFDCQSLDGAELESGDGLPLSVTGDGQGCLGDHWERRLFSGDLMNPVIDDLEYSPRISTLTLAYFADSGWYQVDLAGAKVEAGWGRGAGCNFVNDTCIGVDGEVPPQNAPFFCNDIPSPQTRAVASEIHGCTADLSRKAVCSMGQYDLDLPWEYQYFQSTYGSDVGGQDPFMDFCPVYTGFDNGLCSNAENAAYVKADNMERFGRRNSRCLVGSVQPLSPETALCLPIACVIQDRSLRIKLGRNWHRCYKEGQRVVEDTATIVCPDPRRICPTFYCPYDCLGTDGVCDYQSGKCLCEYEGVFEEEDTVLQVCGLVPGQEPGKTASGPFLRPLEPEDDQSAVPHPDSPLSDYYVPDSRSLEESGYDILGPWGLSLVAICVAVVTAAAVVYVWQVRTPGAPQEPDVTFVANRNKQKMVATVLVDMRIRQSEGVDPNESIAETDEHLTESVASGLPSETFSEISSLPPSETMSEADSSPGCVGVESNDAGMNPEEQQIIRRRRIVEDHKY